MDILNLKIYLKTHFKLMSADQKGFLHFKKLHKQDHTNTQC